MAASGSARTRGSWLRDCKWQCKDQLLYLAPRLRVAVQGPVVVFGSTAASGSARTRGSWLRGCKWQCKDQLLYLAPRLQMAVQGPVVVFGSTAASGSARTSCCIWLHGCKWQCKDQYNEKPVNEVTGRSLLRDQMTLCLIMYRFCYVSFYGYSLI